MKETLVCPGNIGTRESSSLSPNPLLVDAPKHLQSSRTEPLQCAKLTTLSKACYISSGCSM